MFPDSSHSGYSDSQGVYTTGEFGFLRIRIECFITKPESFDSGFMVCVQTANRIRDRNVPDSSGICSDSVNVV